MNLKDMMNEKVFVVYGNTTNPEKYAYKIKKALEEKGYEVYDIGGEFKSINDIKKDIDVIDLCINPIKGLELIKNCHKPYKGVIIQPGAEGEELIKYLKDNNINYVEGCALVGLSLYRK